MCCGKKHDGAGAKHSQEAGRRIVVASLLGRAENEDADPSKFAGCRKLSRAPSADTERKSAHRALLRASERLHVVNFHLPSSFAGLEFVLELAEAARRRCVCVTLLVNGKPPDKRVFHDLEGIVTHVAGEILF